MAVVSGPVGEPESLIEDAIWILKEAARPYVKTCTPCGRPALNLVITRGYPFISAHFACDAHRTYGSGPGPGVDLPPFLLFIPLSDVQTTRSEDVADLVAASVVITS
jgi:hypothetical protein